MLLPRSHDLILRREIFGLLVQLHQSVLQLQLLVCFVCLADRREENRQYWLVTMGEGEGRLKSENYSGDEIVICINRSRAGQGE